MNVIILLVLTTVPAMLDMNSLIDVNVEVNCDTIVHDYTHTYLCVHTDFFVKVI